MNKLNFDFQDDYVETGSIYIAIEDTDGKKLVSEGSTDIDMKKLKKIIELCKEYKCSFQTLLELILENITKEEIENLLMKLCM